MKTLNLTQEQINLIKSAVDFYIKIADLQLEEIINHSTISNMLIEKATDKRELKNGDYTNLGKIVDLNKEYVWVRNIINDTVQVARYPRKEIKLTPNWTKYHTNKCLILQTVDLMINLIDDESISYNKEINKLKNIRTILSGI